MRFQKVIKNSRWSVFELNTPYWGAFKLRKEFQEIVLLSEQMLSMAKKSEWEQLCELEGKREILMEDFFSKPVDDTFKRQVKEGIHFILDIDREVMALCTLRQKALRASFAKMGKNRSAAQAYAAATI